MGELFIALISSSRNRSSSLRFFDDRRLCGVLSYAERLDLKVLGRDVFASAREMLVWDIPPSRKLYGTCAGLDMSIGRRCGDCPSW